LPNLRTNVWRGVTRDIARNYKKDDEFTWWSISSCSTSVNVIEDFLGPNSTLFLIEVVNGKDISRYTDYPNENEVILCPGTRFHVVSDALDRPPLHLVHLREVSEDTEEQLSSSLQAITVTKSSKTVFRQATTVNEPSSVKIVTDINGNKYEGEMKDGKKHGKGKINYANGVKYTGDWINDIRTGQGVLTFTNGHRYEIKCSKSLRSHYVSLEVTFVFRFRND
jgi:hypothetical protein